jgi:hypothetical protein
MTDTGELQVEQLLRAPEMDTSAQHFAFGPTFWLRVGTLLDQHQDLRLLGWTHSHLVGDGIPRGLSIRDQVVMHRYFRAPWSITALACASTESREVLWFGWRDGNVVAIDGPAHERMLGTKDGRC